MPSEIQNIDNTAKEAAILNFEIEKTIREKKVKEQHQRQRYKWPF
jgi:hypothetical protein